MFYPKHSGQTWFPKVGYMGFKNEFVVPSTAANIPRFSMLVTGMFCSVTISALHSYSLITQKLQTDFHYNQNDITTISTVGYVISHLTLPFGFIYDYTGPKPIFAIGMILSVIGTCMFALTFNGTIGHSVGALAMINATVNLGAALYDMGSILTVLSWFPLDRGFVIACMKTMTGLSSSVVATLYGTYFHGDNTVYMYFMLSWSAFIGIISIVVFHFPPYHMTGWRVKNYSEDERVRAAAYLSLYMREKAPIKRYIIALFLVISLLILLCTRSIVFVLSGTPTMRQRNPPAIIMIVLYVSLLLVILPIRWLDVQPSWYDSQGRKSKARADAIAREEEERAARKEEERAAREEEQRAAEVAAEPLAGSDEDALEGKKNNELEEILLSGVDENEVSYGANAGGAPSSEPKEGCWTRFKAAFSKRIITDVPEPRNRAEAVTALKLATEIEKIAPQYPTGFLYNIRRPVLICMWITGFCVSGAVQLVLLNSTQIYLAIAEDPNDKQRPALYVALTSIGSAVGRLIMAFIEVGISNIPVDRRVPISVFYIVPPALSLLSCVFFLILPASALLMPMLFAGLSNGFYAACDVLTARTIFSLDIAKHYNSLFFAGMLAVIFMNRLLFGQIVTKNSIKTPDGKTLCIGRNKCVRTTFIVLVGLSAIGCCSSVVIFLSYRRFSKAEIEKRRALRAHLEEKLAEFEAEGDGKLAAHVPVV